MVLPDERWAGEYALAEFAFDGALVAPAVWPTEVLNGLRSALKQDRLKPAGVPAALEATASLRVSVSPPASASGWLRLHNHSQATGLTPYDASYHLLALDQQIPLATQDRQLRAAARAAGIGLLDE